MVTGKNKGKFEKRYIESYHETYISGHSHLLGGWSQQIGLKQFNELPFDMQIGVYLAYYDSLDIHINTDYNENRGYQWEVNNSGQTGFKTRPEAQKSALEKMDELMNNK